MKQTDNVRRQVEQISELDAILQENIQIEQNENIHCASTTRTREPNKVKFVLKMLLLALSVLQPQYTLVVFHFPLDKSWNKIIITSINVVQLHYQQEIHL